MTWRVARSLDTLLGQLNAVAPRRSKLSDGAIGDPAHQSRDSDHNAWIKLGGVGVVSARDFTHDPADGLDCNILAAALVLSRDPRIKYVIWCKRIWTPRSGWQPYHGINTHEHHLHLSVSSSAALFDSTAPWVLLGLTTEEDPLANLDQDQLTQIARAVVDRIIIGNDVPLWLAVRQIHEKVTSAPLAVAAGAVDLDALADKVADRLAVRLAN